MAQFKMQDEVQELIRKFQKLKERNFPYEYVRDNKEFVVELNRQQLRKGIKADDTEVTPYYANIKYKGRRKPVDLYLKGDFYRSFRVVLGNDGFYIEARDYKSEMLLKKYGAEVLGINFKSLEILRTTFYLYLQKEIRKELNL